MPTTIADLWLLTYEGHLVDIRSPLFTARQIEREGQRANWERAAEAGQIGRRSTLRKRSVRMLRTATKPAGHVNRQPK